MYLYEEAATGALRPDERIASTQQKAQREYLRAIPGDNPSRAPPETFGSLPPELGANLKADLGVAPPPAPAPLQQLPRNESSDASRDANPDTQTEAFRDTAGERQRDAAIAREPAAQSQPAPLTEAPPTAAPAPARPSLSPDLVAALRKRAAEAMGRNDIVAARLLLERASAGGDPQALDDLARTYDPAVLEKMGLRGIFPADAEKAARLYKEAQQARATAQGVSPSR